MVAFCRAYPILPQAAAKLALSISAAGPTDCLLAVPWYHHVALIEKIKDLPTRLWYARQVVEQGWSRETLTAQIKQRAHERQGTAVTNFATTLPEIHASLATGLLKDPYLFDFLTLEEPSFPPPSPAKSTCANWLPPDPRLYSGRNRRER